jgi:hypothetical protein
MRNQHQPFAISGGPAFKTRMKRQSKVCAPIRSSVSAQLPDRKQSRQSRADGCD